MVSCQSFWREIFVLGISQCLQRILTDARIISVPVRESATKSVDDESVHPFGEAIR